MGWCLMHMEFYIIRLQENVFQNLISFSPEAPSILEVDTAAIYLAGVKNCTDSVHKFSRAFLLCYESVQFLTPANKMARYHPIL
jgi:hypothetical protein